MRLPIGGGRPSNLREKFMIKDREGYIMTTKTYIRDNPELFEYIGHTRINSVVIHTYRFIE